MGPMASWGPSERDAGRSESEGKAREAGVGGMPMRGAKATGVGGGGGERGRRSRHLQRLGQARAAAALGPPESQPRLHLDCRLLSLILDVRAP